jgi:hypothetical protein
MVEEAMSCRDHDGPAERATVPNDQASSPGETADTAPDV